jgi:hypothetical protein
VPATVGGRYTASFQHFHRALATRVKGGSPSRLRVNELPHSKLVEVEGALVVEQCQVAEDVGFDLLGLGFGIDLL